MRLRAIRNPLESSRRACSLRPDIQLCAVHPDDVRVSALPQVREALVWIFGSRMPLVDSLLELRFNSRHAKLVSPEFRHNVIPLAGLTLRKDFCRTVLASLNQVWAAIIKVTVRRSCRFLGGIGSQRAYCRKHMVPD